MCRAHCSRSAGEIKPTKYLLRSNDSNFATEHGAIRPAIDRFSPPRANGKIAFDQDHTPAPSQIALSTMATAESVKEQVIDNVPKRIKELRFGIAYAHQRPDLIQADCMAVQARI